MSAKEMQSILNEVFADDTFASLDQEALVKQFDITSDIKHINNTLCATGNPVEQTSSTITQIPPQGIMITQAGTYTLHNDIAWQAGANAAITITANNVVLDLNGFTLNAVVQDNSQLISGIVIQDATSVSIRNGFLTDMCFYGIRAEHVADLNISDMIISGLVFNNLNIRNACPSGIHINHAIGVSLSSCSVQYMYVTADSSAGVQLLNTIDAIVESCHVQHMVNHDGSVQGFSYIGCIDVSTSNCSADQLQSHFHSNIRASGHTVLGFIPIFCLDLKYESCSASNITGCSDDCHGMSVFLNTRVSVNYFKGSYVTDGVTPTHTGAKATGLEVYGTHVELSNCSVKHIKAINPQDKQSTGISVWGANISVKNCSASDVIVCDENGDTNDSLGYGTGFGWAPDPRSLFCNTGANNVIYTDCTAANCQVGFDTWFHTNSHWNTPAYTNCTTNILVQSDTTTRTISANPASECNPPLTTTLTNIANNNTYPTP